MQRPTTRFVPAKTDEQLDLQALHRVRSRLVSERTAVINQIRCFLLESGIVQDEVTTCTVLLRRGDWRYLHWSRRALFRALRHRTRSSFCLTVEVSAAFDLSTRFSLDNSGTYLCVLYTFRPLH